MNNSENEWYKQEKWIWIFLIFIFPVGVFLLWKYGDTFTSGNKKICSVVFFIVWLVILTFIHRIVTPVLTRTYTDSYSETATTEQSVATKPELKIRESQSSKVTTISETKIVVTSEEIPTILTESETEMEESCISIVSHNISRDYNGDPVLVIEYAFTNVDDEPASFTFSVQDSVFQNGIECSSTVFGCDEVDSQQQLNDVQPGFTYNLKVAYELKDMTTATVIVTDFWGQMTYIEQEIDLGGGAGQELPIADESAAPLVITDCFLSEDYEGSDVLVVEYQFTNIESEPEAFIYEFDDTAFQNGIECDNNVFGCDEVDSGAKLSEIQPGVSITVSVGYHIQDKSDVNIVVTRLFSSQEVLNETISLR